MEICFSIEKVTFLFCCFLINNILKHQWSNKFGSKFVRTKWSIGYMIRNVISNLDCICFEKAWCTKQQIQNNEIIELKFETGIERPLFSVRKHWNSCYEKFFDWIRITVNQKQFKMVMSLVDVLSFKLSYYMVKQFTVFDFKKNCVLKFEICFVTRIENMLDYFSSIIMWNYKKFVHLKICFGELKKSSLLV